MATHANTFKYTHTSSHPYILTLHSHTCSHMLTDVHIYPHSHTGTYACLHMFTCVHSRTHTHAFTSPGTHTNSLCPCRHTHVLIPAHTHSYNHTLCALPWESGGLTALSADIRQVQLEEVRPPPPGNSQSSSILSSKRVEADGDPCGPGPGSDTHSGIPAGHWLLRA